MNNDTAVLAAEDNLLQDAGGWDPITICRTEDTITRLYVLSLLVAIIVGVVRIVKLWIEAPPFLLKRQINNPRYLRLLEMSCSSTKQWMGLAVLGWAFMVSYEIARLGGYADERSSIGWALAFSTIQHLAILTEITTVSVLVLFLFRWHMLNRIHSIRAAEAGVELSSSTAVKPEINP